MDILESAPGGGDPSGRVFLIMCRRMPENRQLRTCARIPDRAEAA